MSLIDYSLYSVDDAVSKIANVLRTHPEVRIEVFEDKCFQSDKWLSLGQIAVSAAEDGEYAQSDEDAIHSAVRSGQFNWDVPSKPELANSLKIAMGAESVPEQALFEAIQDVVRRLSLMLPTFDVETICGLPLKRPVTVVVDTSSVLQGGLDFVARFLYPMARIKVPAVVPLEVLSMADNFLALRRDGNPTAAKRAKCFRQHIKSQAGQRALLRLEWHSDIEVERPMQGGDPLRMIFDKDKDPDVNGLNLSTVQRSYADRFVYESAKEHQSRLSPGHSIKLLTSDQGLARMALAEGMQPMYFEARKTAVPFGKKLTGTLHHPFKPEIYSVPLAALLWELATCFGSCRLCADEGETYFQVTAMAEDLIWYPYQSKDDVLWCSWNDAPAILPVPAADVKTETDTTRDVSVLAARLTQKALKIAEEILPAPQASTPEAKKARSKSEDVERIVGYIVSPTALLHLVGAFSTKPRLNKEEVLQALGVHSDISYSGYKSFLASGNFVNVTHDGLEKTGTVDDLWEALLRVDLITVKNLLCQIPSFSAFLNFVEESGRRPDWVKVCPMRDKATTGYKSLSELSASTISLPQIGIGVTNNKPSLDKFCERALVAYDKLSGSDKWILTGEWLEELAWSDGISPIVTRELLDDANSKGLLNRYFEGSTPDTRFATHTLDVLERVHAVPIIKRYQLYQGDFMSEEKASVRVKIERGRL